MAFHCARMDQCARMHPSQPDLTPHMDNMPAWISVHARMAQWPARLLFDPEDGGSNPACGMARTYCSNYLDKPLHAQIVTENHP